MSKAWLLLDAASRCQQPGAIARITSTRLAVPATDPTSNTRHRHASGFAAYPTQTLVSVQAGYLATPQSYMATTSHVCAPRCRRRFKLRGESSSLGNQPFFLFSGLVFKASQQARSLAAPNTPLP